MHKTASSHSEKRITGDYRVIITSNAANQRLEFSIITYVITLNHTISIGNKETDAF
jgi:hypothetical protein